MRQLALRQALSDPSVPVKYERSGKAEALAGLAGGRFDLVIMDVPAIPADFKGTRKVYGVRALAFYVNVANTLEGAKSDSCAIFSPTKSRAGRITASSRRTSNATESGRASPVRS